MSDFSSLRPPSGASQPHSMGTAPIGRSSSPIGSGNASRYSLGGMSNKGTPSEQMLRKAQQQQQQESQSAGVSNHRSPSMGTMNGGGSGNSGLSSAAAISRFGPRPSSEMIGMPGMRQSTNETDAIDKWFEDLQHYEATLEEMATASLDQNFKEELSAIEQWFRVLSEAERTAALYSLLQESTQVQIRFFITVLQQMARSDPMSALLSPSMNNSMAEQMEAKLASLGLKSPGGLKSPASPGARGFARQSEAFLSPQTAQMYSPGGEAAATLAAQRAKLKANRVSAPGTFTGDQRNFTGGNLDQVREQRGGSPNPLDDSGRNLPGSESSMGRPKSIDGLSQANNAVSTPRRAGPLDNELSPIPNSGNWSSMVNTPLNNLFDDNQTANINLDATSSQLASLAEQANATNRILLEQDVAKYQRRKSGQPGYDQQQGSPNLGSGGWGGSGTSNDFLRQAMAASPGASGYANFSNMSPNSFAGLQSPSGGFGNGANMQMMNAMATMGGLNHANAAQFLAMQQQIMHNQQQIAAMAQAAHQGGGSHSSRSRGAGLGGLASGANIGIGGRRSPAAGGGINNRAVAGGTSSTTSKSAASQSGGGGGEEEVPDMSLLSDIPAWLRHLRLHKYTPNFESSNWKEMVVLTDSDLEAKGVAALGARRKLLKTFKLVREKYGIKGADDAEVAGDGAAGASIEEGEEKKAAAAAGEEGDSATKEE
ncbi:hypothetical protein BCV69DRAFT_281007 [Microstroma glucosiphilum]|uniref:RNA-binding protein VTS1 n=1 Tax=Pseudomicrostroma glucosiphilum TaxID=1684307 RepID=A0A316UJK1_9BASI|nr:hypothetical protein BCV69DRAFT_281007 [Pseudomicrostroma glucosiphilum]PWN23395.1 hypothetical protein BCV69DRAFT_281007 [Pseudomicrostroma glucosiphilum]